MQKYTSENQIFLNTKIDISNTKHIYTNILNTKINNTVLYNTHTEHSFLSDPQFQSNRAWRTLFISKCRLLRHFLVGTCALIFVWVCAHLFNEILHELQARHAHKQQGNYVRVYFNGNSTWYVRPFLLVVTCQSLRNEITQK